MTDQVESRKLIAASWFKDLRDQIRNAFEQLEEDLTGPNSDMPPAKFEVTQI